jgi:hypothetical protein
MTIRPQTVCALFGVVLLSACGDEGINGTSCAGEDADINRVPTARAPDWEIVFNLDESDALGRAGDQSDDDDIAQEYIQAWDCIDLSWWTPSAPQKVVQVWTNDTSCELYESSSLSVYACDSHEGPDDLFRDADGDGFYASEGDCNDENPVVYPDSIERCDHIDNDCDGVADEYLDCEDIEAADDNM